MSDPTEQARRKLVSTLNESPQERDALQEAHGKVWDTIELARDFEVIGFAAPLIVVKRKADNVVGSLFFQHYPRYYFSFQQD